MDVQFLLWLVAVALFLYGLVTAFRGDILIGILICIAALLIGPGGVTIIH